MIKIQGFIQCLLLVITSALWGTLNAHGEYGEFESLSQPPKFTRCNHETHGTAFYGAQCAQITLPKNDNHQTVTINVLRARALSKPKNDPLIVITGGPGTSAVSLAWQYLRFFSDIQKERDILLIDQRGTGKSAPFICEEANDIDQNLPVKPLILARNKALIQCAKNHSNESLNNINTRQAADDINAVREALGYKTVNLWGSSYGTRVAMEYQKHYPHATRTVTLDGVAPATIALPRYAQYDAAVALQQLFLACHQQSQCHQQFGDLTATWHQLINTLNKQPVKASFAHPRTTKTLNTTISAAVAANWVRFALYSRELAALLPLAISKASQGNFEYLANLAQTASDSVSHGMSYGMHAAILCAEDTHAQPITREIISAPPMPFAVLNDLTPACKAMPNNPVDQAFFEPISSDIPTLLLSGRFDPITPAFWGNWASQKMSNSLHITIDGGHHGVSGLGCIPALIATFIEQGELKTLKTQCAKAIKPAHFFIDAAGPAMQLEPSQNLINANTTTKETKP